MTGTLPKSDRLKLARLLERHAPPTAADLVKARGLTWFQVMAPAPIERKLPELGTWRAACRSCLEKPEALRPWEATFLRDLLEFRRLSTKQRYVLKEIADRVLGSRHGK